MKASRINHPATIEAARVREIVRQTIEANPGITVKDVALKMGQSKQTIYQHIGILRGQGKLISEAQPLDNGHYGKQLGYSVPECEAKALDAPSRFDYPTQVTVAAIDGAKLPDPDPILSALFGRNKETA